MKALTQQPSSEGEYQGAGVSVVVPVFNSVDTLDELVDGLHRSLSPCSQAHEIILVDDGSSDGSWSVIKRLAETDKSLRGFRLSSNSGEHSAVLCGIRAACHELTLTLDDDLQHPPAEVPKLLESIRAGSDVIYGVPATSKHSAPRRASSAVWRRLVGGLFGMNAARELSTFRVFRTSLREAFAEYGGPTPSVDVLLRWATSDIASVEVRHEPRAHGRSNYGVARLLGHSIDVITGFSSAPLRMASAVGLFCMTGGLALLVAGIVSVAGDAASSSAPWFIASLMALIGGANLLAIGILGEYLARVHRRLLGAPTYHVRESIPADLAPHPPPSTGVDGTCSGSKA